MVQTQKATFPLGASMTTTERGGTVRYVNFISKKTTATEACTMPRRIGGIAFGNRSNDIGVLSCGARRQWRKTRPSRDAAQTNSLDRETTGTAGTSHNDCVRLSARYRRGRVNSDVGLILMTIFVLMCRCCLRFRPDQESPPSQRAHTLENSERKR